MVDYTTQDLTDAVWMLGVLPGDVVFTHATVGLFGRTRGDPCTAITDAMLAALGPSGTWAVPTFSYSFGRGESGIYDRALTPSKVGMLAEHVRARSDAYRSPDPMFSVAAVGKDAHFLTWGWPSTCFGPDSIWARLVDRDAWLVNMNLDAGSTLLHYVERMVGVPYREHRVFTGTLRDHGRPRGYSIGYYSRDIDAPGTDTDFCALHQTLDRAGVVRYADAGRGGMVGVRVRDFVAVAKDALRRDPYIFVKARAA